MGCGCIGPSKDKYSVENLLGEKIHEPKSIQSKYPLSDYVKKVFNLINKVRVNPSEFVSIIETSSDKYVREFGGKKIFDNNKIKVSLNEGKQMFQDCANYLKSLQPMEELSFCDDIVIECPKDEKNIKDINFFREKLLKRREKLGIEAYFKDSIRIPEISVLLMLVDDSIKNPRKKRLTLLNPKYKLIGISSSDMNELSFEKEENKKFKGLNGNGTNQNDNSNENNNTINNIKIAENINKPFCAYFTLK
jgi:hypothetical protein